MNNTASALPAVAFVLLLSSFAGAQDLAGPSTVSLSGPPMGFSPSPTSVTLTWNAPKDRPFASPGQVVAYDLRFTTSDIFGFQFDETSWNASTTVAVEGEPVPAAPATPESVTVGGLTRNTIYFFAIRSVDNSGNWSPISPTIYAVTAVGDDTPPWSVNDLRVVGGTLTSVTLEFTASADDGNDAASGPVAAFDLRHGSSSDFGGVPSWPRADVDYQVVLESPMPWTPGSKQRLTVNGLEHRPYLFCLRLGDDETPPNWGGFSPMSMPYYAADFELPAAVTTLALTGRPATFEPQEDGAAIARGNVLLTWSAPGDEGGIFPVARYLVSQAKQPILTEEDWAAAPRAAIDYTALGLPKDPGLVESFEAAGLEDNTDWYFCVRSTDAFGKLSPLSNSPSVRVDWTPAGQITDLRVALRSGDLASFDLVWTAPADTVFGDPVAVYDLRFTTSNPGGNPGAFLEGEAVPSPPSPSAPGSVESLAFTPSSPTTVCWFAIRTQDAAGNWSSFSPTIRFALEEGSESTRRSSCGGSAAASPALGIAILALLALARR